MPAQPQSIHWNYVIASLFFALAIVAALSAFYFSGAEQSIGPTGFATSASQVGNLSVGIATSVACTWSNVALNIAFGTSLDPGTNNYNATGNYNISSGNSNPSSGNNLTMYNVTVSTLTNVNVDIVMSGHDLVDSSGNRIGMTNITWNSNTTLANASNFHSETSFPMNESLDGNHNVTSDEAAGSTVWFRFWLDTPSAQVAGTYTGNYTQRCQES